LNVIFFFIFYRFSFFLKFANFIDYGGIKQISPA